MGVDYNDGIRRYEDIEVVLRVGASAECYGRVSFGVEGRGVTGKQQTALSTKRDPVYDHGVRCCLPMQRKILGRGTTQIAWM